MSNKNQIEAIKEVSKSKLLKMASDWGLFSESSSGNQSDNQLVSPRTVGGSNSTSDNERSDQHHSKSHKKKHPKKRNTHELNEYLRGKPVISVNKTRNFLRNNTYAARISRNAAAALTGIVQSLIIELILEAEKTTRKDNRKRISPRLLCLAIQNDSEISKLLAHVTIPEAGIFGLISTLPDLKARGIKQKNKIHR